VVDNSWNKKDYNNFIYFIELNNYFFVTYEFEIGLPGGRKCSAGFLPSLLGLESGADFWLLSLVP